MAFSPAEFSSRVSKYIEKPNKITNQRIKDKIDELDEAPATLETNVIIRLDTMAGKVFRLIVELNNSINNESF